MTPDALLNAPSVPQREGAGEAKAATGHCDCPWEHGGSLGAAAAALRPESQVPSWEGPLPGAGLEPGVDSPWVPSRVQAEPQEGLGARWAGRPHLMFTPVPTLGPLYLFSRPGLGRRGPSLC